MRSGHALCSVVYWAVRQPPLAREPSEIGANEIQGGLRMQRSNVLKILLVVLLYAAVSRPGQAKALPQADTQESSRSAASLASSSRATANSPAAQVKAGTKISAELQSAVNARTAKPGDEVKARVTHDVKQDRRVAIHKGNMLLGHVVEAQAGAYKAGSRLAITFDKL